MYRYHQIDGMVATGDTIFIQLSENIPQTTDLCKLITSHPFSLFKVDLRGLVGFLNITLTLPLVTVYVGDVGLLN